VTKTIDEIVDSFLVLIGDVADVVHVPEKIERRIQYAVLFENSLHKLGAQGYKGYWMRCLDIGMKNVITDKIQALCVIASRKG
jgi:hypothetical protein